MRVSEQKLRDAIAYLLTLMSVNDNIIKIDLNSLSRQNWEKIHLLQSDSTYGSSKNGIMELNKRDLMGYTTYLVEKDQKHTFSDDVNVQSFHFWVKIQSTNEKESYIDRWAGEKSLHEYLIGRQVEKEKYYRDKEERERIEAKEREQRRRESFEKESKELEKLKRENPEKYLELLRVRGIEEIENIVIKHCPKCKGMHEYDIGVMRSRVMLMPGPPPPFSEKVKEFAKSLAFFPFKVFFFPIKLLSDRIDQKSQSTFKRLFICPSTGEAFQAEFRIKDLANEPYSRVDLDVLGLHRDKGT